MKCANCGAEVLESQVFCVNCGSKVAGNDAAENSPLADAPVSGGEASPKILGASLESAVQENKAIVDEIASHDKIYEEAASRWAEAEAMIVEEDQVSYAPDPAMAQPEYAQGFATQGQTMPAAGQAFANGQPSAPSGFVQPQAGMGAAAAGAGAGAAAAAGMGAAAAGAAGSSVPSGMYSPNAHFSSQRSYNESAYGQDTGQPGYRPPAYGQGPGAQARVFPQPATQRAFAMVLYISGLIGIIIALCVRDKNDAFITHHLNNCVVITIGAFVSALLSVVIIGFFLGIYLIVMTIMGIVSAYNGNTEELPLIGKIHIVS